MSSAPTAQSRPGGPAAGDPASAATARWAAHIDVAMSVMLAAGFIALFFRWFQKQHGLSFGNPDWSHAYIIPLISAFVVWRRRAELARIEPSVFWPGLAPLAFGVVCYYFFVIGVPNHMLQGFSVVMTVTGLALMMLGPRVFPLIVFPIAYLGFGVTVAQMVMEKMTAQLQLMASWGAWMLLNILGPVIGAVTERAGNVLTITTDDGSMIPLNVAEACSGMRMVVAFYALGVAVAFLSCRHWWQRIALLLLAGPVAVFVNVLRVAFLGLASMVDSDLAAGDAHMMIGVLWLLPAFLLFLGIVWALNRIVREGAAEKGAAA